MRIIFLWVILLVAFTSCSPKTYIYIENEHRFGDLSEGFPDKDSTVTAFLGPDSIVSRGKYAVTVDNHLSDIKTGYWKEYYANGQVRSEGIYKVSSYLNCCMSGPCRQYYSYRDGLWKYYLEDGTIAYELEFKPSRLHVNTNCEGGDTLIFGLITSVPLKYVELLTPEKVFELQKVVITDEAGHLTYTSLNGEMYIRYDPIK